MGGTTLEALRKGVVFTLYLFMFAFCRVAGGECLHSPPGQSASPAQMQLEKSLHDFRAHSTEFKKVQGPESKRGRLTRDTRHKTFGEDVCNR